MKYEIQLEKIFIEPDDINPIIERLQSMSFKPQQTRMACQEVADELGYTLRQEGNVLIFSTPSAKAARDALA